MTRDATHDGAAVKARNPNLTTKTEQEPGLKATYPIGPSSTIDPALRDPSFTAWRSGNLPVVLAIPQRYLGIWGRGRNAGRAHRFGIGIGTLS
jgi:hypothetical protein